MLHLVAELLGVWILHGLDRQCGLRPRLPLDAALVHHRSLHSDSMSAQDGKIEQELGAEVVIVGFHPLLDLIGCTLQRYLKGIKLFQSIKALANFR